MHEHHVVSAESSTKEYLKFGLVLVIITGASFVLQDSLGHPGLHDWMGWFMGVFFLVFASFKLVGYETFSMMFASYDIIAKRYKPYSYTYPFIELGLAVLYLTDTFPISRNIFTILLMGISSIGVYQEIKRRSGIHCACLGNIIKLPLSTVSLIEDATMGIMALMMLIVS